MKLSAKLFTALAALALLVVAVVGTSQTTHAANTDGAVYLSNKWSKLTTNPAGFAAGGTITAAEAYVGAGKTLYATFVEKNAAGVAQQSIETNADVVIVTVVDADKDLPVAASSTTATTMTSVGQTQTIPLAQAKSPIVDANGDGVVNTLDVTVTHNGSATTTLAVSAVVPGSATTPGIVTVVVTSAACDATTITLAWSTSGVDTLQATVKSTQDPTGITITLTETAAGTGVFRGEVQLIDAEVTGAVSTTTGGNKLIALNNATITASYDDNTPATGTTTRTVSATAVAETSAPQATVTAPVHNAATQERRPVFSGSVLDTGSGLKLSTVIVYIDPTDDPTNITAVQIPAHANVPTLPTGAADGNTSLLWTFTPGTDLPAGVATPDHKVDWQVRAVDLAGNIGTSDSDNDPTDNVVGGNAPGEGSFAGRGAPHVVKIDRVPPGITAAYTGHYWDAAAAVPARKQNRATSLEVVFDGPISAASIDNTDFEVVIGTVTHVPIRAEVYAAVPASVFLSLGATIPSDAKPTVRVVGSIADTAGNTTITASKVANDSLAPVVTLALSGGSAPTNPTGLTKADITATITSDESLTDIRVKTYKTGSVQIGTDIIPINLGGGVYQAVIRGAGLTPGTDQKVSVVVLATDAAPAATLDAVAVAPNTRTVGDPDTTSTSATVYKLDQVAPVLTTMPANLGTTNLTSPFVTLDFAEKVTIDKATFDGVDVKASLVTTDDQKWIYRAADLALGTHTIVAKATDLAGNASAETTSTFSVVARADFALALVAGWNAVSVPANPVTPDIDSVFTNTAIDVAIAYDAQNPASPWRIATRNPSTGLFVSTTERSLTDVRQGLGYWVHTDNFQAQKVALQAPPGPGAASPPTVVTIPTGNGWNFVGVVDVSGANTTGASGVTVSNADSYFASVNWSRAYTYNATALQFTPLVKGAAAALNTGAGVWVFVSPQADGSLPAIVP